jgi:hypothetical protein
MDQQNRGMANVSFLDDIPLGEWRMIEGRIKNIEVIIVYYL